MLQTFLQIGKKLREDTTSVQFLPFVEFGEKEARYKGEKIIQEKPFVQVYDVKIDGESWNMEKSKEAYDENSNVTFIKGDNNDRFYIAGDINVEKLGGNLELQNYFNFKGGSATGEKKLQPLLQDIGAFNLKFRNTVRENIAEIEMFIKEKVEELKKINKSYPFYLQFRFLDKKSTKIFYWEDCRDELEKIGEVIIKAKYIQKSGNEFIINKKPFDIYPFITYENLNAFQSLDRVNSYKVLDVRKNVDPIKNLIISSKYISGREYKLGRMKIQILPTGKYSIESLRSFLKLKTKKRTHTAFQKIQESEPSDFNIFEVLNSEKIYKYDFFMLQYDKAKKRYDIYNYVSSVNRTYLENIRSMWERALERTIKFRSKYLGRKTDEGIHKNLSPFSAIEALFKGDTIEDKKLVRHQRIILYKILRNQYFNDPVLLNNLIVKLERICKREKKRKKRQKDMQFLFFNFIYLTFILNNKFQIMKETQSYKAGILLGKLARNLDRAINSFSKQYAGNISRRISKKEDLQKLLNFIQEKLVMHDKVNFVRDESTELNKLLANFSEPYKRDYVVAGFFYSYMMPFKKPASRENSD